MTDILVALCIIATLLAYAPGVSGHLGDHAANEAVRLLTAPFVHGFTMGSALPHLVGNLLLLLSAGRTVELLLGSRRFVGLTMAALLTYAGIQFLADFEVNGASVFVWAYAPPLAVSGSGSEERAPPARYRNAVVLTVMWAIVPTLMTTIPYAYGWRGSVVGAFLVANTFHLSATLVGVVGAWIWRPRLRSPHS